ncbi:MAG TPA: superoxide dismutase family protein, partial [Acidimicrobiales bacterium]|nr:superoxide dismutase family protein [Acidimicrobiales bacterium]
MRTRIAVLFPVLALAMVGYQPVSASPSIVVPPSNRPEVRAVLRDASGVAVGQASFRQADGYVAVRVEASGLAPGWHGMHVHTTGT